MIIDLAWGHLALVRDMTHPSLIWWWGDVTKIRRDRCKKVQEAFRKLLSLYAT